MMDNITMLKKTFILIQITLLSYSSFAADEKEEAFGVVKQNEQDTLESVLEIEGVADHVATCEQEEDPKDRVKVMDCLWKKIEGTSLEKEVTDQLKFKDQQGDKKNQSQFSALEGNSAIQKNDKALAKLEDFLQDRLTEELYGKDYLSKKNSRDVPKKFVDHQFYTDLFRSQLGKNAVTSITSYCLDSHPGTPLIAKKSDIKDIRAENLKSLSEKSDQIFSTFFACMGMIAKTCECLDDQGTYSISSTQKGTCKEEPDPNKRIPPPNTTKNSSTDKHTFSVNINGVSKSKEYDLEESRNRSCEVTRYLRKLRGSITQVEAIQEQFRERAKSGVSYNLSNYQQVTDQEKKSNNIINIGSSEIYDVSGIKDLAKEEAELLEKCKGSEYQSNAEICDQYSIDEEESNKIFDEFSLRQDIIHKKIKDAVETEDDDQLAILLKEEGYNKEEVEKMLEGTDEEIKEKMTSIRNRFKKEKEALKNRLNKKLKKITRIKDDSGNIKMEGIKEHIEDIKSRPERFRDLAHYTNVVYSQLEVRDSDDKKVGKNTEALKRELKFNSFGGKARNLATSGTTAPPNVSDDHIQKLEELSNNGSDGKSKDGKKDVTTKFIDSVLDLF
jgi:hypothetical protein